ncbi:hypothetical protein HRR83_004446 [Exophiala dermatitidis]|uniref:Secreted protein n=1 Tax=Exophiala dermatitidis TaxID=5970 RepID=A0AAN6F1R2_EXODE|nr:hypothetical protein HRR74_004274 [Exophiala dermatitidis]KAJ4529348.1 hypothetical protein HRR73_000371 [Exophiala dermatitidis]KAJ4543998.1 hypothetical protein HRR76_002073 [Exophiala dermatitidis]KAJ4549171.1 hypothetical protein HRR77_004049 [Exophiala dermatitidis]KAJ4575463.1 hypothetical protein HRR79_002384 [Exophiala dermatitidis]
MVFFLFSTVLACAVSSRLQWSSPDRALSPVLVVISFPWEVVLCRHQLLKDDTARYWLSVTGVLNGGYCVVGPQDRSIGCSSLLPKDRKLQKLAPIGWYPGVIVHSESGTMSRQSSRVSDSPLYL